MHYIVVNCTTVQVGGIGYCNCTKNCSEGQGDCNSHDECNDGLFCGSNNCKGSKYLDCCYKPKLGDEHFCTTVNPCGEGQGGCDSNDQCLDGLFCGSNNCSNCCSKPYELKSPNYPDSYPIKSDESWLLIGPIGSIIVLHFEFFKVRKLL